MGGTDTIFILVPICSSSYFAMKYCSGEVGTGSVALLMLDGKLEADGAVTCVVSTDCVFRGTFRFLIQLRNSGYRC